MTTHPSSMIDLHHAAAESGPVGGRGAPDLGPYAQPVSGMAGHAVDAVLIDAIRASVGPYVPTPWRTRPADSFGTAPTTTMSTEFTAASPIAMDRLAEVEPVITLREDSDQGATELPWIDAYLDAADTSSTAASDDAAVGDTADTITAQTETADEWPLDEAGAVMRALADDLTTHDEAESQPVQREATPQNVAPQASTPPLPMWGDDDLMDIMPTRSARPATDNGEHWAARARRETERAGNPEAAAQALEALARRVRDGEIALPGYSQEMGDAAALAAALAALLGVRR